MEMQPEFYADRPRGWHPPPPQHWPQSERWPLKPFRPTAPRPPSEGWELISAVRAWSPALRVMLCSPEHVGLELKIGPLPSDLTEEVGVAVNGWWTSLREVPKGMLLSGAAAERLAEEYPRDRARYLAFELLEWLTGPGCCYELRVLTSEAWRDWLPVSESHREGLSHVDFDIEGSRVRIGREMLQVGVFWRPDEPLPWPCARVKLISPDGGAAETSASAPGAETVRPASEKQVREAVEQYLAAVKEHSGEPNTDRCWEAVRCILPGATRSQVRDAYQKLTGHRPRGRRPRKP